MDRISSVERKTHETDVQITLNLDGGENRDIQTGIPFFDHMLTLFAVHGFLDLSVKAAGDIEVDFHHTVEDVGIVLGDTLDQALGDRIGIARYGHAVTPMDETLTDVAVDLSKRPFLVFNVPDVNGWTCGLTPSLTREFFRSFVNHGGLNLHVNVRYGENDHHIIESVFKAAGRAIHQAAALDPRIKGVRSSKGSL